MSRQFDVIVIGAGNAGFAAARTAHDAGLSVAMVEPDVFGGTCPNRGCTPKKVLVAAAQTLEHIRHAQHHGIEVSEPAIDWARLIQREQSMIDFIPKAMEESAASIATLFRGEAVFTGPKQVAVNETHLTADHIVIATGSIPRPLPIPGAEHLVTSNDLLTNPVLPEEITFIGGGVVALEFAHVFARAGVSVTILEALPNLLPRADQDAVQVLRQATESIGIRIITDVKVKSVVRSDDIYSVVYECGDDRYEVISDKVVNGTGRIPAVSQLNLEAANIKYSGTAIETDEHFRSTSNPAVWVAGDALATTAQLSPVATEEGKRIGLCIAEGTSGAARNPIVPQAIHTIPVFASVGLSEEQAREHCPDINVQTTDLSGWFSARTHAENTAWAKIITNSVTDRVMGAHLIGHRGEDLIHLFALAMEHGIPASSLKQATYAFPTFSSDIKNL